MITLPHRCEFLSDAWLDDARKFLERECKIRKEALGSRSFSLSEHFTQTPPHLKFENDAGAWSMRYDGESVSVAREFNESADMVVEGDYQAALTAAQFVGVLAPGAMAAMMREVATMFGKDAIRRGWRRCWARTTGSTRCPPPGAIMCGSTICSSYTPSPKSRSRRSWPAQTESAAARVERLL
jgi:hypothetical protein